MNRRTFVSSASGVAATAAAGCLGFVDESSSGGWNGDDIGRYVPWLVDASDDADPERSYYAKLISLTRAREIAAEYYDLFDVGGPVIPEVDGLNREDVDQILQVGAPYGNRRCAFTVWFGDFDTDSIRRSLRSSTDEEIRQIGGATIAHDEGASTWVGVSEDWVVTRALDLKHNTRRPVGVERPLRGVNGKVPSLVNEVTSVRRLVDKLSLHHSLRIQHYPSPESEYYSASTFPELPLVAESAVGRVKEGRYERKEHYVFTNSSAVSESAIEEKINDRIGLSLDDSGVESNGKVATVTLRGPIEMQSI